MGILWLPIGVALGILLDRGYLKIWAKDAWAAFKTAKAMQKQAKKP